MGKRSGGNEMTRGDRRRNARRERLRGLLPRDGAVIGIDLAEDKQALAVIDHDVRVLARKTVKVKAFRLGQALDWAAGQARVKGFERVTVACEPTGPRWMQVQRLCAERGLPLVCIQPLMSHIAREQQDYTPHKTDLLTEPRRVTNPPHAGPGLLPIPASGHPGGCTRPPGFVTRPLPFRCLACATTPRTGATPTVLSRSVPSGWPPPASSSCFLQS